MSFIIGNSEVAQNVSLIQTNLPRMRISLRVKSDTDDIAVRKKKKFAQVIETNLISPWTTNPMMQRPARSHRTGWSRGRGGTGAGRCILGVVVWRPCHRRDGPRGASGGRFRQWLPRSLHAVLGVPAPAGDGQPPRSGRAGGPEGARALRDAFATAAAVFRESPPSASLCRGAGCCAGLPFCWSVWQSE